MHDNNDDGGHRTPLRWPPRVGRRQWKPRADQPGQGTHGHGQGHAQGHAQGHDQPGTTRPDDRSLRDGSRDTSSGAERAQGPHAKQPNERDESVEKVGVPEVRTKQRKTIQRAFEDVTQGRLDTDVRGHLHETYGRLRRKPDPSR